MMAEASIDFRIFPSADSNHLSHCSRNTRHYTNLCPCHPQTETGTQTTTNCRKTCSFTQNFPPPHSVQFLGTGALHYARVGCQLLPRARRKRGGAAFKTSSQSNQNYFQSCLVAVGGSSVTSVLSEHHPPAVNSIGCCCSLREQQKRHKPSLSPGPCPSRDSGDRDCRNVANLRLKSPARSGPTSPLTLWSVCPSGLTPV